MRVTLIWLGVMGLAGTAAATPDAAPYCVGDYADDFSIMPPKVRDLDHKAAPFSHCVRNTATYECLSYASDGTVRKKRRNIVFHGTGFAYRQDGGDTLLLTNEHVSSWPLVTDDEHRIEGVPSGCKRLSETIKLVDGESDDFAADDIPVVRVVDDPRLDAAILKAVGRKLDVMPWRIGRASVLRPLNAVEVRGFPLGAFRATSLGKVISASDRDQEKDWDHVDFVIDALLSSGNSGSPVLAVSCSTGELELVGMFHAGYIGGSALNVVVGIEQLQELMATLKRTRPARLVSSDEVLVTRDSLSQLAAQPGLFFPFGPLTAATFRRSNGSLLFVVFGREFPVRSEPVLVLEDSGGSVPAMVLGRAWVGESSSSGLRELRVQGAEPELHTVLDRLFQALERAAKRAVEVRQAEAARESSPDGARQMTRAVKALRRESSANRDLAQELVDLDGRWQPMGAPVPLARILDSAPTTSADRATKHPASVSAAQSVSTVR